MEEKISEPVLFDSVTKAQLKIIGETEIANNRLLQSIAGDVHSIKGWITFFGVVYILMVVVSILAVMVTMLSTLRF